MVPLCAYSRRLKFFKVQEYMHYIMLGNILIINHSTSKIVFVSRNLFTLGKLCQEVGGKQNPKNPQMSYIQGYANITEVYLQQKTLIQKISTADL